MEIDDEQMWIGSRKCFTDKCFKGNKRRCHGKECVGQVDGGWNVIHFFRLARRKAISAVLTLDLEPEWWKKPASASCEGGGKSLPCTLLSSPPGSCYKRQINKKKQQVPDFWPTGLRCLLGYPHPILECPVLSPSFILNSSFLLKQTLWGSRWWFK